MSLCLYLCLCLSFYLSICLSVCLSVYDCVCVYVHTRFCVRVRVREVRSTQTTGKEILAAALEAVDAEAARQVRNERNWRFRYSRHFVQSVEASCASPEAALSVRRRVACAEAAHVAPCYTQARRRACMVCHRRLCGGWRG